MHEYCKLKDKKCGFCATWLGDKICGIKTGENRIINMDKCPRKKKK